MTSIGAEVGQKMRSAIKAKLLELNCYVDDELPDYIMVMVANKRTKSQMKEDLQLFLTTKTSTFVEWLHIVLKKLKEVTVTNPEVYKKSSKRKSTEVPNVDLKKEKKEKKSVKKEKEKKNAEAVKSETADSTFKSLTDDLPISANKLSEQRKIIIMKENQSLNQNNNNNTTTSSTSATEQLLQDNFDIPPLSEVNMSTEEELETIERKIKSVKSRLGILVESEEDEDEEDYINLKAEPDELFNEEKTTTAAAAAVEPSSSSSTSATTTNNKPSSSRTIHMVDSTTTSASLSKGLEPPTSTTTADNAETEATGPSSPAAASAKKRSEHTRITFENNKDDDRSDEDKSERKNSKKSKKRRSVLERLGKRRKHNRSDEEELDKVEEAPDKDRDDGSREQRHKRDKSDTIRSKRNKISLSEIRKEEEKFLYNCGRSSGGASSSGRKSEEKSDSGSAGKSERKKDGERYKESVLSRLGVMSKVSVPLKPAAPSVPQLGEGEEDGEEVEEPIEKREVPSVVKVRPRVIPPDAPQANKNLLLKAVAEAQKSIAQTPRVGINAKPDALFTKKYKEKTSLDKPTTDQKPGTPERSSSISSSSSGQKSSRLNAKKSTKQLSLFTDRSITLEYVPAPIGTHKGQTTTPEYIPSSKSGTKSASLDERHSENNNESAQEDDDEIDDGTSSDNGHDNGRVKQQFIVTLDGIDKTQYKDLTTAASPIVSAAQSTDGAAGPSPPSIKTRLDKRRSPSPIIFDGAGSTTTTTTTTAAKSKSNIPDKLPIVHPPPTLKNKERCKYWPTCRQGDKCEFVHPTTNCEMFPKCKFGDRCLYLHPVCKFGSSCTRRDCPYSHNPLNKNSTRLITAPAVKVGGLQTCKYFPNCANLSCNFYHPKPCRFGKHCKNQSECTFSHSFVSNRSSLTWRPK